MVSLLFMMDGGYLMSTRVFLCVVCLVVSAISTSHQHFSLQSTRPLYLIDSQQLGVDIHVQRTPEYSTNADPLLICTQYMIDTVTFVQEEGWYDVDLENLRKEEIMCAPFVFELGQETTYLKVSVNLSRTSGQIFVETTIREPDQKVVMSNRLLATYRLWMAGDASISEQQPSYSLHEIVQTTTSNFNWEELTISLMKQRNDCICNGDADRLVEMGKSGGGWCLSHSREVHTLPSGRAYTLAIHHFGEDTGLAQALAEFLTGQSVIDLGAGQGQYDVNPSIKFTGYDGAFNVEAFTHGLVTYADLGFPLHISVPSPQVADWIMSLEVGEHIPPKFEQNFMHNIHKYNRKGVIISWATPFQPGHGHVNPHTMDYIKSLFLRSNYEYDDALSLSFRSMASREYFRTQLMVFRKTNRSSLLLNGNEQTVDGTVVL